ncbi:Sodium Bile acid symporter family protein [Planctomycetes bacterium Pan216]|uniref:Sodium Bile acid symporter family protein n=1 Tax=Kolteria novifilia TaxID=2527975 RepID=A0A518AYD6_9BACT|nr:Sodium Bile acid symporter family protein [Planctomycetes bacterium Pan216]
MIKKYLLAWLALLALLALLWPAEMRPHPRLIQGLVVVAMLAIGSLLPRDELQQVLKRWPTVLGGTLAQYLTMPLLANLFGRLFNLGPDMLLGVVLVGCVPGAMASNVLTMLARGNVSYSISLTTCSTLLSPLFVPLAIYLSVGEQSNVGPILDSFWQLLGMVVAPVVIGHLASRQWPRLALTAERLAPPIANIAILLVIAMVIARNQGSIFGITPALVATLAAINFLGYLLGYAIGKRMGLDEAMRRALTLEIGMQNSGVGAALALLLFENRPDVAIPPVFYMIGCMVTGTILARWWGQSSPNTAEPTEEDETETLRETDRQA